MAVAQAGEQRGSGGVVGCWLSLSDRSMTSRAQSGGDGSVRLNGLVEEVGVECHSRNTSQQQSRRCSSEEGGGKAGRQNCPCKRRYTATSEPSAPLSSLSS